MMAKSRPPLVALEIALSWRLDLARAALAGEGAGAASPPLGDFEVREVARDELAALLEGAPALRRPLAQVDAVAPAGWRGFVAFERGAPVSVSFVELRPRRPLLFGVVTEPAARGRGAFRATLRHVVARLREAGETSLFSSTGHKNRPSVRAHRAGGFAVFHRTIDVRVRGLSLRHLARRLLRR
jgi:GNAT superfamily N-acetyltransferase